jgi:hypothetical protein
LALDLQIRALDEVGDISGGYHQLMLGSGGAVKDARTIWDVSPLCNQGVEISAVLQVENRYIRPALYKYQYSPRQGWCYTMPSVFTSAKLILVSASSSRQYNQARHHFEQKVVFRISNNLRSHKPPS